MEAQGNEQFDHLFKAGPTRIIFLTLAMFQAFCTTWLAANTALLQILLVGDSGVGKSSLLVRFTENQFQDATAPTIGMLLLALSLAESKQAPGPACRSLQSAQGFLMHRRGLPTEVRGRAGHAGEAEHMGHRRSRALPHYDLQLLQGRSGRHLWYKSTLLRFQQLLLAASRMSAC